MASKRIEETDVPSREGARRRREQEGKRRAIRRYSFAVSTVSTGHRGAGAGAVSDDVHASDPGDHLLNSCTERGTNVNRTLSSRFVSPLFVEITPSGGSRDCRSFSRMKNFRPERHCPAHST